jgi:hypothetical protein
MSIKNPLTPAGILYFFFCKNCVFVGTYTLPSQQVYSCFLLVSLWHTVHNVTARRDESLREWEMLLSKLYGAILSPFSSVLNESGANGVRGGFIAHLGSFLLWVSSWVLGGILSSRLVARSPCSR